MNPKPKILIIDNSPDVTGALKSISAMARELSDDFDFVFVLPSKSRATTWITDRLEARVYLVPMLQLSRSAWSVFLYLPMLFVSSMRVRRIIHREQVDIVHSNDLYNLIGPLLKFSGAKFEYVCHVRFLPDRFPRWLFLFWLRQQVKAASALFVVSQFLRERIPASTKIITLYDRILVDRTNEKPVAPDGSKILLYLSNIIPGKGQQHAIDAFAKVSKEHPGWKLRFVGSDMGLEKNQQFRESLIRLAQSNKIDHQVEFIDFTPFVSDEYRNAAIVLNFSESESFSMTCLEGQFHGRAVIATNSGGPSEIIQHEMSGILVPTGDVDAMSKAIARLMGNKALRESMGAEGAELMRVKFGRATTTDLLGNMYRQILAIKVTFAGQK